MTGHIQIVTAWFEGRPHRERLAIAATAVVVIVSMFELFWWAPARDRLAQARTEKQALESQKTLLSNELALLEQRESLDPDAALLQQLDVVQQKIAGLDEALREQTLQILTPEQMPAVLRDLIDATERLQIVRMRSEPPERLVDSAEDNRPVLYRHGLVLDLRGEYLALLDCVRTLEELPWRLYWLGMEVRADGVEPADFRLHVYTISLREEWIRV